MRPIDADALTAHLHDTTFVDGDDRSIVYRVIDTEITIDPVKHGKWMRTPTGWAYCSVCRMEPPNESNETTDYCPNCGARMDKEE